MSAPWAAMCARMWRPAATMRCSRARRRAGGRAPRRSTGSTGHEARLAAIVGAALLLAGCSGWQSALDPHSARPRIWPTCSGFSPSSARVVWLLVAGRCSVTLRRRPAATTRRTRTARRKRARKTMVVGALTALTVVILTIFTLAELLRHARLRLADTHTLTVKITGQQWWWDIEYQNDDPPQVFQPPMRSTFRSAGR